MLLERAVTYAKECISGKEITTPEVVKQCEWFLSDLEKQKNEYFPYFFDQEFILQVEDIFKFLNFATGIGVTGTCIYDGLSPHQCFFFANIFGWKFKIDRDLYRYTEVILFIPRKNAKTFDAALIIIVLLLTEDNYSEFYSICLDRDLAGRVKKTIVEILQSSPKLQTSKYFTIPKTITGRVECKITHSFYQPRTADANSNNSIQPSAFIADEIGAFTDNSNITAMRSGQLSVKNPLMFKLTTAYAEDKSIMLDELDYLKKIYAGLEVNDQLFALLYYADEKNLWTDKGLEMANPLKIKKNLDELKRRREIVKAKEKERVEFLTKHLNHFMPSFAGEEFINIEKLRLCKNARGNFDWSNRDVYVGLDLAQTGDNVSVSIVTLDDDMICAKSWAFIPAGRLEEKNQKERTDYRRFIDEGSCFACGDEVISYKFVEDFVFGLEEKFGVNIIQIGYDRWNCISTAEKLAVKYETIEVKQHSSVLHPPTKLLQESIWSRKFSYDGSKLYEINFQNARCTEDTNLNKYVNKKKSKGKVDMVVSTIIGLYLLQQNEIIGDDEFVAQVV